MIFYHRTTTQAAQQILKDGFRDATGAYLTTSEWTGVWLSDVPLDVNEGAVGDCLLRVDLQLNQQVSQNTSGSRRARAIASGYSQQN